MTKSDVVAAENVGFKVSLHVHSHNQKVQECHRPVLCVVGGVLFHHERRLRQKSDVDHANRAVILADNCSTGFIVADMCV